MSMINDGGPAFPGPDQTECTVDIHEGMTLRDYFAARAMLGIITGDSPWRSAKYTPDNRLTNVENDAKLAYRYADAMLAARGAQ
ncbi:hypothetical protein L512_3547 [Bordetella bronchiseptica MBORD624]|uniref:hypothetical protein n=1 Tax=Bordetella bronchiseptica TaxID=518 RepID=UPI0004617FAB|nr:hypothetical protein [Bordetella bronchiseptica]KDC59409.1 hypothetical protein L511_4148 [Bordetella bronchiseptica MBORD595]KDC67950.1 hypothetical protein L512_3547 [Bordetella bronchiseptica MBORD624]